MIGRAAVALLPVGLLLFWISHTLAPGHKLLPLGVVAGFALLVAAFQAPVQHAENRWNKEQGRYGGEKQTADHGTAKRCILLATIAEAQSHRDHAEDHGERGHEDGAEADEAGVCLLYTSRCV